ncbi:heavy-metal-associated domain-containing protein [Promicromonospora sp. MS192]|uniref:heavy-metal-associated domain-containing protein n=1 Tax=Promicromonospora sp. MS192 TaxID=3412684 RepID=UPI003C2B7FB7
MNAPQRLGLYGGGLAALFAVTFAVAGAVVPDGTVAAWSAAGGDGAQHAAPVGVGGGPDDGAHGGSGAGAGSGSGAGAHGGSDTDAHAGTPVRGLSLEQDGLLLGPVRAPDAVGEEGTLSFTVTADGAAVTDFATEHDKELHLVVVRSDGAGFRHVHPTMAADGTWSIPWAWDEAGSYRVYADFVPAATGENVTLSRTVDVAGRAPAEPATRVSASDTVDGYTATLTGDLGTEGDSVLTARITQDGEPVTGLEPYLGAYGHLVALRAGDLAYLHVHPEGAEPAPGSVSGPDVTFVTSAPTPGRYLLYLDFKVDGVVRTAHLVLDTTD